MSLAIVLGAAGLLLAAVIASGSAKAWITPGTDCPNCRTPMAALPDEAPLGVRSYRVHACRTCTNVVTQVHGARSRWAWCPACRQRALETPVHRLPNAPDGSPQAEVHELCHICGHELMVRLPELTPVAQGGKVLHFRRDVNRRDRGQ